MEESKSEFQLTTIRVCFDLTEKEMQGYVCAIALPNKMFFSGTSHLIQVIGQAYKIIGRPQPVLTERSFFEEDQYNSYNAKPQVYHSSEDIRKMHGKEKTLDMTMISIKHAEWQGVWREIDGTTIGMFRSMLECIRLIYEKK